MNSIPAGKNGAALKSTCASDRPEHFAGNVASTKVAALDEGIRLGRMLSGRNIPRACRTSDGRLHTLRAFHDAEKRLPGNDRVDLSVEFLPFQGVHPTASSLEAAIPRGKSLPISQGTRYCLVFSFP